MAGLLIAIDNDPGATGSVHESALGKVLGDRAGDADDGDDEECVSGGDRRQLIRPCRPTIRCYDTRAFVPIAGSAGWLTSSSLD